ncbi:MAG: Ig-like domain-containing protein [Luteolibacter sp.]|uniref:Ig-like domain-containing protein n=1 Tax=Luteolibacter sp. TaxID=1962973 RepID=UPI00326665EB
MKLTPRSHRANPRYLLATLLLPWLPLNGQTITNPGFETDTFATSPGYASANGGIITGWTLSPNTRIGINTSAGPFANNGAIPQGTKVAFLQAGTTGVASISQVITGLTNGTKYNVSVRINARTGQTPSLQFSTDGTGPTVSLEVTNVTGTNPYKYAAFEFTATGTSNTITFSNTRAAGDHTVLIDDVIITPSTGAWSFAPWTGDADSGADSQYPYTHAVNFGTNTPVTIHGVNFVGRETGTTGRFTLTNLDQVFGNRTPNNVTGVSANLAKDFRYNGANTSIKLENLKPSTQYVFTAYGLSFDAGTTYRSATFTSDVPGSNKFSVNLNQYGQGNGIRVNYTYTTDALGTPVLISYPTHGSGTWHTSGFSNREAVASTQPTLWTTQPWTDDASSGILSDHVYTHAVKFGAATNVNINGINFAGVAGGNPVATNYTSANLPSVAFNNTGDANNAVAGYSATLAHNFIFDGYPAVHNLSGLTPGKAYVFTLYSTGWDTTGISRKAYLIGSAGEQATILDQSQYGLHNGIRFEYAYTASASGTARITIGSFESDKSVHCYGISNREAAAMVGVAPQITLHPIGATVGIGSNYTLRSTAIGSSTLTYQWKLNGTEISGATDPVLQLFNLAAADSGAYTLVATNGTSSATSNPASLSVLENVPGVFSTGVGLDGLPLAAGATDPHFKLLVNPDNVSTDVALVQSNTPGSWLPNTGASRWIGAHSNANTSTTSSVDAGAGAGTYIYRTTVDLTSFTLSTVKIQGQWASDNKGLAIRVNGVATGLVNDTGVTFGVFKPFIIDIANAPGLIQGVNTIDFVVNNEAPDGPTGLLVDGFSAVGAIPPGTAPHIGLQPVGGNGLHNGTFTMTSGASGSSLLTYQWYKGVTPIVDATDPNLTVEITDLTAAGSYKVRATNGSGFADSNVVTVTVNNAVPLVVDDNLITNANTPLAINVFFDLLGNDTDADGDGLTLAGFSATSFNGGTVTQNAGIITYTPAANFSGSDGFTYTVNDGWGGTSIAGFVNITVNAVANTPPGQITLVLSGGAVNGTFTGTVGATYVFERSTTLEPLSWTPVDTVTAATTTVNVSDPSPPAGKAFYRIKYAQ